MLKIIILLASSLLLISCGDARSYDYLMTHPLTLKKMMLQCDESDQPECEDVRRAAQDFSELINQRRDDPEKFGMKILAAQEELADLKLNAAPQVYAEQQQKIKIYYAVVALTSGE